MSGAGARLEVAYLWRRHLLAYRLLERREKATLGTARRVTFTAPANAPWPRRTPLLKPVPGGFRLRVQPGMSGQIRSRGELVDVAAVLQAPVPPRPLRGVPAHRDLILTPGDGGELVVDARSDLRLRLAFVDPPKLISRPRRHDPLLFKTGFATVASMLAALVIIF